MHICIYNALYEHRFETLFFINFRFLKKLEQVFPLTFLVIHKFSEYACVLYGEALKPMCIDVMNPCKNRYKFKVHVWEHGEFKNIYPRE